MNVLCVGDIVGKPGREIIRTHLDEIKKEHSIDFVIVNGENAAAGSGITSRLADELLSMGCDVITLGDHTWDQKDLQEYLNQTQAVIRPANFPEGNPGKGWGIYEVSKGIKIGVVNIIGRVFMRYQVDCPFRTLEGIVEKISEQTPNIIVDFHAETTSEKIAMGHFINGKISALYGTHTHVQTADEKILSEGTAYITDLGMTGPHDSVIGQDKEIILERFLTSRPIKFHVAENDVILNGIVVEVDEKTGKARKITRVQKPLKVD